MSGWIRLNTRRQTSDSIFTNRIPCTIRSLSRSWMHFPVFWSTLRMSRVFTCSCSRSSFCSSTSRPSFPCCAARKLKKRLHFNSTSENCSWMTGDGKREEKKKKTRRLTGLKIVPRDSFDSFRIIWTSVSPGTVGVPGQSS